MDPFDEEENCQGLVETRQRLKAGTKCLFNLRMSILRADDVEKSDGSFDEKENCQGLLVETRQKAKAESVLLL
jgi:hypothetical protein